MPVQDLPYQWVSLILPSLVQCEKSRLFGILPHRVAIYDEDRRLKQDDYKSYGRSPVPR